MSLPAVELACLAILALGLLLRARAPGFGAWRRDALPVFVGAWIGEQSCISLYRFYTYADGWHARLGDVPLLVPVIWIFVLLSARDVAQALTKPHAKPGTWLPLAFAVVWYDASLIEPVATHSGLWRWHEAGPMQVPWIGMLGWACYGAAALGWLAWRPLQEKPLQRLLAVAVLAPLTTHGLLLLAWWGLLRHVGRSAPQAQTVAVAAWLLALGLTVAVVRSRRLPLALVLPRVAPALFFFGLLAVTAAPLPLWAMAGSFALPWLAATRWTPARA